MADGKYKKWQQPENLTLIQGWRRDGLSDAQIAKKIGIKTENMAGHISKYARTNYSETIAEAGADVYCNGKKANKASRAIMKEIKAILK